MVSRMSLMSPVVLLHGLPKPLLDSCFCFCNNPGCRTLGLPVPVSCPRSPLNQPSSHVSIPSGIHHRIQGLQPRKPSETIKATAPNSCINKVSGGHCPLEIQCLQPPSGYSQRAPRGGSTRPPRQRVPAVIPSRPSQHLPPGGDHLTALFFSSPKCPRHTAEGQMTGPQSRALTSGLGFPDTTFTDGHPYA